MRHDACSVALDLALVICPLYPLDKLQRATSPEIVEADGEPFE